MGKREISTDDTEPAQSNFKMPSEGEHLFQVIEKMENMSGEEYVTLKFEVADKSSDELGVSMLHRVSFNSEWKGFFMTRLFLKVIGMPYKGTFTMDEDDWMGKCFKATIKHTKSESNGKTYANIDKFNVDDLVEQYQAPVEQAIKELDIDFK